MKKTMLKTMYLALLCVSGLLAGIAGAQTTTTPTWFVVTSNNESTGISASVPAGTTYDAGCVQDNLWSAPVRVTAATSGISTWVLNSPQNNPNPDPKCPTGLVFRVQETAAMQVVQIIIPNQPIASITVPALPAVTAPPPTPAPVLPAWPVFSLTLSATTLPPVVFATPATQNWSNYTAVDSAGNTLFIMVWVQPPLPK